MRLSFVDYLYETRENHAVLAFGRMNPPTTGHEVLVNKVKEVAAAHNASHHIVLSHSQDKDKNPLSSEQKLKHAKRFFPKTNLSVSTKEEPNFLAQAAKLHKQGVTHLHMVAGSDRVPEFHKLLHKYNGTHEGALFNFKDIKVHSAGERDPDAEGTTGMSASKMRSHASSGNFNEFRKGIPSHVPEHHAKELYNDVRKGMNLKEQFQENLLNLISEGVNDKSTFKVVFLAGGPGSGKDHVMKNTLNGLGLVEINSDNAFEYLLDKYDFDKKMTDDEEAQRELLRKKAKTTTELRERLAIQGRNGVIINGTGDDPARLKKMADMLQGLGYDTPQMLMVNTRDAVSYERNKLRGERGGRTVPENIRKEKWDSVQAAIPKYKEMFGSNFYEYENSTDLKDPNVSKDFKEMKEKEFSHLHSIFRKYAAAPVVNDEADAWREEQKSKARRDSNKTMPEPDTRIGKNVEAPSDTYSSSQEPIGSEGKKLVPRSVMDIARSMGLTYMRFGRFGKDGKVTHKELNGELIPVKNLKESFGVKKFSSPIQIANKHRVPILFVMKQLKAGIKVEHEHTNSHKMARVIALQHLDEYPDYYSRLKRVEARKSMKESYTLSDTDALNLLTLNGSIKEQSKKQGKGSKKELIGLFSKMLELLSSNEINVNESKNQYSKEFISEEVTQLAKRKSFQEYTGTKEDFRSIGESARNSRRSDSQAEKEGCFEEDCGCQEVSRKTKSSKEKVESYDSPSASGDSMTFFGAGSPERITRFKGKASVTELSGDENAVSIPDQKEDELRKQGITLSSFKSKNSFG